MAIPVKELEKQRNNITHAQDVITGNCFASVEIGDALIALMRKKVLKKDQVVSIWEIVQQIPVELRQSDMRTALSIAVEYNIYAYDVYFIECAKSLNCPLLTLDRGMQRIAQEIGITVLE